MSERNIDVVISAKDEFTASLLRGTDGPGSSLLKLIESFKAMSSAASEAAEVLARLDGQLKGVEIGAAASAEKAGSAAAAAFLNEKELMERRYTFMGIAFQNEEQFKELAARSAKARANITGAANKAMEDQMLSLVETGRFSTEAFGEIIYQQVKMELAGIAAISAVKALYYGAVGLGLSAFGDPRAVLAFNAAAGFALISSATYAAAKTVQAAFWGQEEYKPPASSTGGRASGASLKSAAAPSTPLAGYATDMKVNAPQKITIQIYNPLSEQNWQKIVEDNIVPAINSASERNIAVTVKNMGG